MKNPYDLSERRSVVEYLPRYASRESSEGKGPYEPTGIIIVASSPDDLVQVRSPYQPTGIVQKLRKE